LAPARIARLTLFAVRQDHLGVVDGHEQRQSDAGKTASARAIRAGAKIS